MSTHGGKRQMNYDVRTAWEKRIGCVSATHTPGKAWVGAWESMFCKIPSRWHPVGLTVRPLPTAAEPWVWRWTHSKVVAANTCLWESLCGAHQIHSCHAERCLLLNYVSMGLYSEGVVFVACPPQPALRSFPDQHRPWLHGRWHSKEWFSPPFREACRLWFSMWVQWCGLLSAPSSGGLCPQSRKQAGRLRGHLILIDTVKFPVMSPGGSGARL